MPNLSVSDASSLADLRVEIDRLDEAMHNLLMQRGEIIDRLIRVKQTQESGSAFRPAREAEMMRRLLERHKGILPLDTAESIWRVIIATFTFVQAPFSVHADLSAGDAMMRDSARFHFGFTVPFVPHLGAASVVAAVAGSKGDLGLVPAFDIGGICHLPRLAGRLGQGSGDLERAGCRLECAGGTRGAFACRGARAARPRL